MGMVKTQLKNFPFHLLSDMPHFMGLSFVTAVKRERKLTNIIFSGFLNFVEYLVSANSSQSPELIFIEKVTLTVGPDDINMKCCISDGKWKEKFSNLYFSHQGSFLNFPHQSGSAPAKQI